MNFKKILTFNILQDESAEYSRSVSPIRDNLVNIILYTVAFLGLPTVVASLWRTRTIGWHPLMSLHVAVYLAVVTAALLRKRLSTLFKTFFMAGVCYLLGAAALLSFALSSAGAVFLLLFCFVMTLLVSRRAGAAALAVSLMTILGTGVAISNGWIMPRMDVNVYVRMFSNWIVMAFTFVLAVAFIVLCSRFLIEAVSRYAHEVEERSEALERTNENLRQEVQERKRAEEQLTESKRHYQTLFEAAGDAILLMRDDRFVDCNSQTLDAFGCTREQIIGKSFADFSPPYQPDGRDSQEKALEKIRAALAGPPQHFEWSHVTCDGKPFAVEVGLNRVELGSGLHLLSIIRDISERKMLEQQLLHAQKMEAVGVLAGGLAHDFNNILSAIIGYATLMDLTMKPEDPLRHDTEKILASAERAAALTQSLLAFSRKQIIDLQTIDINDVIHGIHNMLTRLIGEDIEFELILTAEKLAVKADRGQLDQVLMNLVTNARDAMPRGGKLRITTGQVHIDDELGDLKSGLYAGIVVSDTGSGMDKDTQEHIFEPFYTTKGVGKGTGLGLSIVYGIIKEHNGAIRVYSEPRQGTTFNIYLPLIPATSKEIREQETVSLPVGTETILLVEDDASVRLAIKAMLREFGYSVIEAVDGEDAVRTFRKNHDGIHLVLCDLIMPKMNGKETYEELKKIRPDIKALFVSGYTADIILQKGIHDEGINLIAKPLKLSNLLQKIRKVLES